MAENSAGAVRQGFYYDQTSCIGCRTCQIACKDRNDLEVGVLLRTVTSYECGTFPSVYSYHYSAACNHCENPACVANCPTGAMYKDESGAVLHDDDVCIGCKACLSACPYGVPRYSEAKELIIKCDSCKALRDQGMNPVCVDACPMRALEFGDIDELKKAHGDDLVSEIPILASASITTPNVLIKPRKAALESDYREIVQ